MTEHQRCKSSPVRHPFPSGDGARGAVSSGRVTGLREDGGTAVTAARFAGDDDVIRLAKAAALGDRGKGSPTGIPAARLALRGVTATLAYRLDSAEHVRRCVHGLLAVTDLEKLDVMLGLPVGLPVPKSELRRQDWLVIDELPHGCVKVIDGAVTRQITRPLRVDLAVLMSDGEDWRSGLQRAGQFSTYCTRLLAIPGVPNEIAEIRAESAYYGVGLVVNASTSPLLAVPPERFIPTAHTAAGWRFTEQVYSEIVRGRLLPTRIGHEQ
jgi:hypothetical protein